MSDIAEVHNSAGGRPTFVGLRKPVADGLIPYSMGNLWSVLSYAVRHFEPTSACEIGVEKGLLFRLLYDWQAVARRRIEYTGIDPYVADDVQRDIESNGGVVIRKRSFEGIAAGPACDLYILDGDHNYVTVRADLDAIAARTREEDKWPLIVAHDVCWPTDRRDAYYMPSFLEEAEVRPYTSTQGVRPDSEKLFDRGAIMATEGYCWATEYGGESNGVLSAVEDFIAAHDKKWELLIVPGCFGVGLVYAPESLNERQRRCLHAIREGVEILGGLVETLEYNRLQLYCALREREDELQARQQELKAAQERLADVDAERKAAQQRLGHADAWFESVQRSLTWRLLARFTIGRSQPPLGGSRQLRNKP